MCIRDREHPEWVQKALYENDNDAKSAPRESEAERLALVLAAENAAQELIDQLNAKGIR